MPLFKEAIHAVERNLTAVGIYLVVAIFISASSMLYVIVSGPQGSAEPTQRELVLGTIIDVVFTLLAAVAQTLAFSRIGKDIDRPLWKVSGDREALQRYFPIWAIIGILIVAIYRVLDMAGSTLDSDEFKLLALIVYLALNSLATPIGACLMFARRPPLSQAPNAMLPLIEQFPYTLIVTFFSFGWSFFVILQQALLHEDPASMRLRIICFALSIVGVFIDCVIFALVWLMCKDHRDNAADDDFEF